MGTSGLVGMELDLAQFFSSKNRAALAAFLRRLLGVFLRLKLVAFVEENPVSLISGKLLTVKMK